MGNTHQAGIKKDDHGVSRDQQPQAASVAPEQLQAGVKGDDHGDSRDQQPQVVDLDQFQAGAAERARNQLGGDGGGHDFETTSMLKDCKKNSAADGGGRSSMIDILRPATGSVILRNDDDPHHLSPPSLPEPDGVEFVLHTLPVKEWCIGDGDGFTAYVKKAVGVAVSGSYKKGDTNNRAPQQYRIRMSRRHFLGRRRSCVAWPPTTTTMMHVCFRSAASSIHSQPPGASSPTTTIDLIRTATPIASCRR